MLSINYGIKIIALTYVYMFMLHKCVLEHTAYKIVETLQQMLVCNSSTSVWGHSALCQIKTSDKMSKL